MSIWTILGIIASIILSTFALGVIVLLVYGAIDRVTDLLTKIAHSFIDVRLRWFESKQKALQASIQILRPDDNGFFGIVRDGKVYHNLDSGEVFTQEVGRLLLPIERQLYEQRKMLAAMSGISIKHPETIAQLPDTITKNLLPSRVKILDLVEDSTPTLDNLIVAVTLDETGEVIPIRKSINDLMHLLAIGITGAGKSTWVLSFLSEIAMCQERIDVMCIDVHGSAFNILSDWDKLRYPIARNNEDAKAILSEIRRESDKRAKMYESIPLAENLPTYNQYTTGEKIDPWLVVIDEGTLMLADKSISDYVASCVQGTRQYGIYVFMTGQTANHSSIPTPIRDNFPTRLCFITEPRSMQVALGITPERELDDIPGRGWARLKGKRQLTEIQAPYISRPDFLDLITRSTPKFSMPVIEGECVDLDFDEKVLDAWDRLTKKNPSKLCYALGGKPVGAFWYKVKEAGTRLELFE